MLNQREHPAVERWRAARSRLTVAPSEPPRPAMPQAKAVLVPVRPAPLPSVAELQRAADEAYEAWERACDLGVDAQPWREAFATAQRQLRAAAAAAAYRAASRGE